MSIASKLGLKNPTLTEVKDAKIAELAKCRARHDTNCKLQAEKLTIQKGLIAARDRAMNSEEAKTASADRLPPPQAQVLLDEQLVAMNREVGSISKSLVDSENLLTAAVTAERLAIDAWALSFFIDGIARFAAVFDSSMLATLDGLIEHAALYQRSGLPYDLPGNLVLIRNLVEGILTSLPQYLEQPKAKLPDGMKVVRWLKSSGAHGAMSGISSEYSAGEKASFPIEVARELLRKGYVEIV